MVKKLIRERTIRAEEKRKKRNNVLKWSLRKMNFASEYKLDDKCSKDEE